MPLCKGFHDLARKRVDLRKFRRACGTFRAAQVGGCHYFRDFPMGDRLLFAVVVEASRVLADEPSLDAVAVEPTADVGSRRIDPAMSETSLVILEEPARPARLVQQVFSLAVAWAI
jgi:hypothetical protein